MRRLGTLVVTASLVAVGWSASSASSASPAEAASGCRHQWTDLTSLHGENGNPEGSATVLVDRWDAMYAFGLDMEEHASPADCGAVIDTFAREWGGLETFMYDLHPFDMPLQLAIDEGDRKHWVAFQHELGHPGVLSQPLKDAFHRLRRQAPRSSADLATVLAGVPDVDVSRPRDIEAFVADVARAAKASRHYELAVRADRFIDDAELSEE
jgi:hypothetical protein